MMMMMIMMIMIMMMDNDNTGDERRLRSAGGNDRRSKRFCSDAMRPVSFT